MLILWKMIDLTSLGGLREKVQNLAYSFAWEQGHSYGYREVFNCLEEISEYFSLVYAFGVEDGKKWSSFRF